MQLMNASIARKSLTLVAPFAIGLMSVAANAADVTFVGQVPSGTDPLGGNYFIGDTGGGLVQFEEITGLQADPTQSAVTLNLANSGLANVFAFTLTITGSSTTILSPDVGFGVYFESYLGGSTVPTDWTATLSADGKSITYAAASASDVLLSGDGFNTITTLLSGGSVPSNLSYSITYTGAAVPEMATWATMVGGFGMVGGAVRRRKIAVRFA